jgi:hypothetical protein
MTYVTIIEKAQRHKQQWSSIWSKTTYDFGGAIHAECHRTRPVADVPDEQVFHPRHHLLPGELALHDPGGIGMALVLVRLVHSIMDQL